MKKNEKGIATIESVLLLSIFVVFMTYMVGMFGVIHSGILNSISARAYNFEAFRNRANLNIFRDSSDGMAVETTNFYNYGYRAQGITSENNNGSDQWYVTERVIAKGRDIAQASHNAIDPNDNQPYDKAPNNRESRGVNPVYIKTVYGICLTATCGGGS